MSYSSRARPSATALSCGLLAACLASSSCGDDATSRNEDPDEGSGKMDRVEQSAKTERGATIVDAPPLHVAANDMVSRAPMDAAPTADGERVYYTALGQAEDGSSVPGIFATGVQGGEIETLLLGDPLTAPVGISVSPDGARLFIADSAWMVADGNGAGAIVTMTSDGGTPSALSGTEGFIPRGLVIADVSDETWLYFTGVDPERGEAGVFRTSLEGGSVETVASGAPFVDPAGLAVTGDGVVYAIDALASTDDQSGQAALIKIEDGAAERFVEGLGVGFPAGVAVPTDASVVLVSGLDPVSKRDRVFLVDPKSGALSVITEPFDDFTQPAGLHRAHDTNTFAWADSEANGAGTVYTLEL